MVKGWGGVARRGARVVGEDAIPEPGSARSVWREAMGRDRPRAEPEPWEPEVWVDEGVETPPEQPARTARPAPRGPTDSGPRDDGASSRARARRVPPPVADELARVDRRLAPRLAQRLGEAVRAYERDRYQDARRILRQLVEAAPDAASVRELHGLTLYRMNRWAEALKELEAFRELTGSYDQHPVMADCYRALKRWRKADGLWEEVRAASPGAEVVAEGRIVHAGALADRGRLDEAIALLERAADAKRPRLHHLRTWYALADLYERAGDVPRARALFSKVLRHDAEFADVAERLAALG